MIGVQLSSDNPQYVISYTVMTVSVFNKTYGNNPNYKFYNWTNWGSVKRSMFINNFSSYYVDTNGNLQPDTTKIVVN